MNPEHFRVQILLKEAIALVCRNSLNFQSALKIEGVIGITVDNSGVFLVHIDQAFDVSADTETDEHFLQIPSTNILSSLDAQQQADFMQQQLESFSYPQKLWTDEQNAEDGEGAEESQPVCVLEQQNGDIDGNSQPYTTVFPLDASIPDNSSNVDAFHESGVDAFHESGKDVKYEAEGLGLIYIKHEKLPLDHLEEDWRPELARNQARRGALKCKVRGNRKLQNKTETVQFNTLKNNLFTAQEYDQDADSSPMSLQKPIKRGMLATSSSHLSETEVSSSHHRYHCYNSSFYANNKNADGSKVAEYKMETNNLQQSFVDEITDTPSLHMTSQMAASSSKRKRGRPTLKQETRRPLRSEKPIQQSASELWDAVTITKFVCKMCGSSFNQRSSLCTHQIKVHGRQKNKRGRPSK